MNSMLHLSNFSTNKILFNIKMNNYMIKTSFVSTEGKRIGLTNLANNFMILILFSYDAIHDFSVWLIFFRPSLMYVLYLLQCLGFSEMSKIENLRERLKIVLKNVSVEPNMFLLSLCMVCNLV